MKNFISLFKNFFEKKKETKIEVKIKKNLFDNNIYCEIIWNAENPYRIELWGYNNFRNIKEFCGELYNYTIYHANNPREYIFIPRIIYGIDWGYIFRKGTSLKEFKLTFSNYSNGPKNYSVILEAINGYHNRVIDSFTSTTKVFIDSYELTDNIDKFIRYSEVYETKK